MARTVSSAPSYLSPLPLLFHAESPGGFARVRLARLQFRGRKLGMIWRVWVVLRLQAQPGAEIVFAIRTGKRSIQEIAGIELHAGLRSFFGENPAAGRIVHAGRGMQR